MGKEKHKIAIVGIACVYPDADNYKQLWENVLAKRRAFRKIPECRLSEAYFNKQHPDAVYMNKAAVLKNYEFRRSEFQISGSSFRTADITHWLALETAYDAIRDSGIDVSELPLTDTGVFVGNTLTGEITRSRQLRLRWPYIAKTLFSEFQSLGWPEQEIQSFLNSYEQNFKAPFQAMGEDSLAGGLSNTIAGRICNYFDFKGGGYTVDGACSSSLLSVIEACNAIDNGSLKVAIAGGVDISLDPFELVGFSRTEALAKDEMLVYDKKSAGFWPGEGCGFIVLMNYEEAINLQMNIYALINGWGISSDGQGGITRPSVEGQLLAMEKAYRKADYEIDEVAYIEGHGTGTQIGDNTELETILSRLNASGASGTHIGSVKGNIGHTKAAAGIAGLIKAVLAVKNQIVPPAAGIKNKNSLLEDSKILDLPEKAKLWDPFKPLKASVSAMGFGGINTHITIENPTAVRRSEFTDKEKALIHSYQDTELFLFRDKDKTGLLEQLEIVKEYAGDLSISELTDLSCKLYLNLHKGSHSVAIVAGNAEELEEKLINAVDLILSGETEHLSDDNSVFINLSGKHKNVGLLFPGQGIDMSIRGELFSNRFPELEELSEQLKKLLNSTGEIDTAVVQPASAIFSYTSLKLLEKLNIQAKRAVGHSFGEIPAMYWSGIIDEGQLFDLSKERGHLINTYGAKNGAMLAVLADVGIILPLIKDTGLSLAVINSDKSYVVSGPLQEIEDLLNKLKNQNIPSTLLNVDHAFHSSLMEGVKDPLSEYLQDLKVNHPSKIMISTVTGKSVDSTADVKDILRQQVTSPVKFYSAVQKAESKIDVWIDMGNKASLGLITARFSNKPVLTMGSFSQSFEDFLKVCGFVFAFNSNSTLEFLFKDRFFREFDLNWNASFISNPCESVKSSSIGSDHLFSKISEPSKISFEMKEDDWKNANGNLTYLFKELLANRLELPVDSIKDESRMLDDLHLNSITVSEIVTSAARMMNASLPAAPTEYANASVTEIVEALKLLANSKLKGKPHVIPGIEKWVGEFCIRSVPSPYELSRKQTGNDHLIFYNCTQSLKNILETVKTNKKTAVMSFQDGENEITYTLLLSELNKLAENKVENLLIVQNEELVNGFVKSFFLEFPEFNIKIVTLPENQWEKLRNEIYFNESFEEIVYDENGRRYKNYIEPLEIENSEIDLGNSDLVLVSGGGKGITAECALALAEKFGVELVLIGRSNPETDEALSSNLERFKRRGIKVHYCMADIADRAQVSSILSDVQENIGEITAIMHGAGRNIPCSFSSLTKEEVKKTLEPKYYGLKNILDSVEAGNLKYVVSFGSIIAESGMQGNADYALANQWMTNMLQKYHSDHPDIKCINLEWSVWSGVGMGEKLNVLESLSLAGINPITVEQGIDKFLQLIATKQTFSKTIVTGRFGSSSTLKFENKVHTFFRFVEDIKIHYPTFEIISDTEINMVNDHYLEDHSINGVGIFPTVVGLEAVQQLIQILRPDLKLTEISEIQLLNPVIVSSGNSETIRIIIQKEDRETYKAVIRTASGNFMEDCFRMRLHLSGEPVESNKHAAILEPLVDLDASEVYGNLLFHKGRFKRINRFTIVDAYECLAEIDSNENGKWFGEFKPQSITGPDPSVRDAILHAVQVCIPFQTLLPVEIKSIKIAKSELTAPIQIYAKEISSDDGSYTYDICALDKEWNILETWESVRFKPLKEAEKSLELNTYLCRNYIRRILDKHKKENTKFEFSNGVTDPGDIIKRLDGKPELDDFFVSRSKSGDYALQVLSSNPVGCDIQKVLSDIKPWADLIGKERTGHARNIAVMAKISEEEASYRIWGIIESFKKAGLPLDSPFTISNIGEEGSVLFNSGGADIISLVLSIKSVQYIVTIVELDKIMINVQKPKVDEKTL